jgi:hypothetical protein
MHRVESENATSANLFTDGPPGTRLGASWHNAVQEEICYVIEQAGLTLQTELTDTHEQLYDALDEINLIGITATAVEINTACDGITAEAAELNRLDSINGINITVANTTGHGVYIDDTNASKNGIHIVDSSQHGIYIADADGGDAINIADAGNNGIEITTAAADAIHIDGAGSDAIHVDGAAGSALEVSTVTGHAINITTAGGSGVFIADAGVHAIAIGGATQNGVNVTGCTNYSLYVGGHAGGSPTHAHMIFQTGTTADPSTNAEGALYYNSTTHTFKYYNGTGWLTITAA